MGEKNLKKTKKKVLIKVLIIVLIILGVIALFFTGVVGYGWYQLSKVKTVSLIKNNNDLGINSTAIAKADEEIVNIAFFGLDRRDPKEPCRSDSIMVLSVDKKHKKIKMNSIMRDTYVKIKDHGETKINHAYAYGQAQLAVRTLNENFDMNIRDFIAVDFEELGDIIDALGGVEINVKENEIPFINGGMSEVAAIEHKKITDVTKTGNQTLSGMQAVSYSRIRHTGDGDFERTERQRTVLTALFNKIKSGGATQFSSSVSKLLPFVETSMSSMDIIKLGTSAFISGATNLEQERFPIDGFCKGVTIDEVWYLKADLDATKDQLHKYIYEDIKPVPGEPLF
jgi:polyisoprenyl-teichoic acid--peptidoglycan teichoic acid transferase